ncbi:2,4-dihydroxyhept-2-enedioate aldolase [Novosphingobium kunmingense]|uniref:2,4-dihydroxyhept-2-enedioate aldolase n=1 Tax=Novosphingobium kunmingense TaxID=1211806 RepID=A0A2N0H3W6_9SPHN|nr:HpcH/HpaI aldolase/citrate lyase family protein [Novosphingobium kunmingense]PKB13619.1 2,4-dihydroxyhept-2-enedioate aldolase [Novosphingobium kunmingense]
MQTPINRFKQALREGPVQLGFWLALADPDIAEICAGQGYDWLLIDGEHGPQTLPGIVGQLRAVEATPPCSAIVRIAGHDPVTIKQVLDLGAQTLMVPMVETAEQAQAIVIASRYPPAGERGLGGTRAARWGGYPAYVAEANAQVCIIAQIETATAVDNIEAIAAVDGIDALFLGPADLAATEGLLGASNFDALFKLTGEALARMVATGKPAGILSRDERLVQQFLDGGARFIANGIDSFTLAKGAGDGLRRWRERIAALGGV